MSEFDALGVTCALYIKYAALPPAARSMHNELIQRQDDPDHGAGETPSLRDGSRRWTLARPQMGFSPHTPVLSLRVPLERQSSNSNRIPARRRTQGLLGEVFHG